MKAVYFEGPSGDEIREEEIPAGMIDKALAKREETH